MAEHCRRPGDRIAPYQMNQLFGVHCVIRRNIQLSDVPVDEAGQTRLPDFGVATRLELSELRTSTLPYRSAMALASDPNR